MLLVVAVAGFSLHAAVADRSANGFTVQHSLDIAAPRERVYAAVLEIGRWWNPAHSYSNESSALSLDVAPGGCFCERLPNGGHVRHLTVVYVDSGKALRLQGGLGPLQPLGVAGSLDLVFEATPSGTKVGLTYAVGGYMAGGLDAMAEPVDGVLLEQIERLRRYVETGSPVPAA